VQARQRCKERRLFSWRGPLNPEYHQKIGLRPRQGGHFRAFLSQTSRTGAGWSSTDPDGGNASATPPLGIVSLLLTPQVPKRKIPATFPFAARSLGGPERKSVARRRCAYPDCGRGARREGGAQLAIPAWLDRAMHQSGMCRARPLAARGYLRWRSLQQLQFAASQCTAPAGPAPADATSLAGQLSSVGASLGTSALAAKLSIWACSPRTQRGEPSPLIFPRARSVLHTYQSLRHKIHSSS